MAAGASCCWPSAVGQKVVVLEDFDSNTEPPYLVRQHDQGVIEEIDDTGFLIAFPERQLCLWVFIHDKKKLRVIVPCDEFEHLGDCDEG